MPYKRLAVVVDTFPRWSERFVARELSELQRKGVELSVFCLKPGSGAEDKDPDWAGLVERRVVLPNCILPNVAKRDRRYELARGELGTFFRRIGCAPKLSTMLKEQRIEHVHAHFASLPSTLAWLAAGELDAIPFSFSVHARDLFVDAQLLDAKLADAVRVFTCHGKAEEFLQVRARAEKSKVVGMHHGLPLDQFPFEEPQEKTHKQSPELLAAGRFVPKKGFHHAIEAMADARLAARDVRLVLMGDGPELKRYKKIIKTLQLEERVELVPPEDAQEMRDAFRRASALLAPYEQGEDGDVDGIPNVILEAFALGTPVIGSTAGSLPEVLTDKTGVVMKRFLEHPLELADALCDFIDQPPPVKQAKAARELIERDFDIRKNIKPMLELLEK